MKKIELLTLLLIYLFFKTSSSYAQEDQNASQEEIQKQYLKQNIIIPPAPEAASLGKYGNVPISLYTGTPNISIPLYEIKGRTLSLPITMSYSATGVQTDEIASWVGLNWSLSAGGVITRSVKGNPDMDKNYFGKGSKIRHLNPPGPGPSGDWFSYFDYTTDVSRGLYETQPDIYFYNVAGMSGKFFIDPDKKLYKTEHNDLKIEFFGANIVGFTITDIKGIRYVFSSPEVSTLLVDDEYGALPPASISYTYTSSWYLTEIISANGNEKLVFTYTAPVSSLLYSNTALNVSGRFGALASGSINQQQSCGTPGFPSLQFSNSSPITIDRIFLQRIDYISCATAACTGDIIQSVNFSVVSGRRDQGGLAALDKISIYDKFYGNNLLKEFQFRYGYFNCTAPTVDAANLSTICTTSDPKSVRLRLDEIQEKGYYNSVSGVTKNPYKFTYNSTALPSLYSTSMDHWGFNNGNQSDYLIPGLPNFFYSGFADREPSETHMMAGILTTMTYPTGGYTNFEFEPHEAKKADNTTRMIGGLRIRKIVDYTNIGIKASVRSYEYTNADGTSSGILFTEPIYQTSSGYQYYSPQSWGTGTEAYGCNFMDISSSSRITLGSFQGSHVGYSRVLEYTLNASDVKSNGWKEYVYSNQAYANPDEEEITNGDLLTEKAYNQSGVLLTETTNTYTVDSRNAVSFRGYKVLPAAAQDNKMRLVKAPAISGGTCTAYMWRFTTNEVGETTPCQQKNYRVRNLVAGAYFIRQRWKYLASTVTKTYDQNTQTLVNTNSVQYYYDSPNHAQLTRTASNTSEGVRITNETKYPLDFTVDGLTSSDPMVIALQQMQSRNMVGIPIQSNAIRNEQFANSVWSGNRASSAIYYFTSSGTLLLPDRVDVLEVTQPEAAQNFRDYISITNANFTPVNAANFTTRAHLTAFDSYGNITQAEQPNGTPTAYVWGYKGMLPIAIIKNATAAQVQNALTTLAIQPNGLTSDADIRTQMTLLKNNLPATCQLTIQTYHPLLGVTSVTDPNGITTFYEYDALWRLKTIRDQNGAHQPDNVLKSYEYHYKQ